MASRSTPVPGKGARDCRSPVLSLLSRNNGLTKDPAMQITDTVRNMLNLPGAHDGTEFHDGRGPWRRGITSVCSAHPLVIEAALMEAAQAGEIACIEATCNQVNQEGGYTGMTPEDFRGFVLDIAERLAFPFDRILFGGDHLGPNPWRDLSADDAMDRALAMTREYARAGFGKLHLDTSMPCKGDPVPLPPGLIAKRAAKLARAAEDTVKELGLPRPAYIIGTEVPVPGGAAEELETLHVTTPRDAAETLRLHREAFGAQGQEEAFARAVALVVQPGVEFGHANAIAYDPPAAADLIAWRDATGGVVFEAHSTDYQSPEALAALVEGGFAILKVGPGLTFALREALYGLDLIAAHYGTYRATTLPAAMEAVLQSAPANWQPYVHGDKTDQAIQRHYSFSDRIRYYWTHPKADAAVRTLFKALDGIDIPLTLVSQYLPKVQDAVAAGRVAPHARALAIGYVRAALAPYTAACSAAAPRPVMPTDHAASKGPEARANFAAPKMPDTTP